MSEFYRSIYWIKDEARLKNYSVSKSKGGKATIRLEIEAKLDRQAEYEYQQAAEKVRGAAQH